jgi:uncharacterized membrane protein
MISGVFWLVLCAALAATSAAVLPMPWLHGYRLAIAVCAAVALPLVGYFLYLRLGYYDFHWAFGDRSLIPIALTAVATGSSVFLLLRTRSLPRGGALILAFAASCLVLPIAIVGGGLISCASGDCF